MGEGQRGELVGEGWGRGTAALEPALWVYSKIVAFSTFQGTASFNKFQLRGWELPSDDSCPPTILLQWPPETLASAQAQWGPWGPITLSPLHLLLQPWPPGLLQRPARAGGKVPSPSSVTSPWLAVPRERKPPSPRPGHVSQLPAMPGDNDRLSVLCLAGAACK